MTSNDPTPTGRAVGSLGSEPKPRPTIPPSADAERIADAIARNGEWYGTEARDLVGAVQSIADDVNSARNAGIDWGLAVTDIVAAIRGLGEEVNSARCDALDAIVGTVTDAEPIIEGDRAIVGWAFTAGGDTLPIVSTAADPSPQIQRYTGLRGVN